MVSVSYELTRFHLAHLNLTLLNYLYTNQRRGRGQVRSGVRTIKLYRSFHGSVVSHSTLFFAIRRLDISEDSTIGNWLDDSTKYKGLATDEAIKRLGIVGQNTLDLKKPTIIGSILREFSKPFYLYQNFMVW